MSADPGSPFAQPEQPPARQRPASGPDAPAQKGPPGEGRIAGSRRGEDRPGENRAGEHRAGEGRSGPEAAEVWATIRRLGAIGPLAAIAAFLPAVGGFALLWYAGPIGAWLRSHGEGGALVYAACFTLLAGLALLPTYAQAIVGGFAFGVAVGFPAALSGFVGAAALGYAIARLASGDRAERVIAEHKKWKAVYDELLHSRFWRTLGIVTLVRFPPNSPFAITNLVLAATKVPVLIYVIGTMVGMAPRTLLAVYIGSTFSDLTEANLGNPLSGPPVPMWMKLAGVAVAIVVVVVIGLLANRAIARVTAGEQETAA